MGLTGPNPLSGACNVWDGTTRFAAGPTRDAGVDFATTKLRLGRELVIDPVTERSTDAEATRLFSRDCRKGFELPRV